MYSQRIGYVRVSSFDQNPERQLEQIQVDRVFTKTGQLHLTEWSFTRGTTF